MDRVRLDLRHVLRSVRARPVATAAAVLVLALGIGLTTAMFALADPYLLRPLPYANPGELVVIEVQARRATPPARIPTVGEWEARDDLFHGAGAHRLGPALRLRTPAGGLALQTVAISSGLLQVLGVAGPASVSAAQADVAGELSLVLMAPAAERLAASDGAALIRQDGGIARVIAVQPDFLFPIARAAFQVDALTFVQDPAVVDIQASPGGESFSANPYFVIARLRPGVTAGAAQAALTARHGGPDGLAFRVRSLTSYMRRNLEPLALGAVSAALVVLLICAGNVGNILLARALYRTREFATRRALGAARADLLRLMLLEIALLALGGIAAGIAVAHVTLGLAGAVIPTDYAALGAPAVNARALAFAALAGLLVVAIAAIPVPAVIRRAVWAAADQTHVSGGRGIRALRVLTAAAQTALAVILLSGAGLLLRSYLTLITQDTGFAGDVHVVSASYPPNHTGARLQADIDATLERLRHLPGVVAVGAATGPMIDQLRSGGLVRVNGRADLAERKQVSPGYFEAAGLRAVQGRTFRPDDGSAVAVVNESFARRHWRDGNPVRQQLLLGARPAEVVGVVRDTFDLALDVAPVPTVFTRLQDPPFAYRVNFVLRLARGARMPEAAVIGAVDGVNPDAIIMDAGTVEGRLADSVRDRTFATLVLTFFAIAAIGVCAAGLIGIVLFLIARRTREIAIRMALGAPPVRIRWLVAKESMGAAGAGAVIGMVLGRWLSKLVEAHLYGVHAGDWLATAAVGAVVILLLAVVSTVPVSRALRLNPALTLRDE